MPNPERSLSVWADGLPIAGFRHARLTGQDTLGLYPMPFTLRLWNPSESDCLALSAAGEVTVMYEHSVLASGTVSDVYRQPVPEGKLVSVVFAAGLTLWETPVSLSVEAGAKVSETVRRILEASGTGISLLSFPGNDPVRIRGQSFYGRAAECVEEALSAAGARGYLTASGLCVVPAEGLPVTVELSAGDLLSDPVFAGNGRMLLRTRVTGGMLGKTVRVKWKDGSAEGLVLERSVDADNLAGRWESELLIDLQHPGAFTGTGTLA